MRLKDPISNTIFEIQVHFDNSSKYFALTHNWMNIETLENLGVCIPTDKNHTE